MFENLYIIAKQQWLQESGGGDELATELGEGNKDLAQPETEEGSLRKTARSRGALGWKPLGTRHGDDPEDLGDDAAGLAGPEEELGTNAKEGLQSSFPVADLEEELAGRTRRGGRRWRCSGPCRGLARTRILCK